MKAGNFPELFGRFDINKVANCLSMHSGCKSLVLQEF